MTESPAPRGRGRAKSTSKEELARIGLALFIARGFDELTIDDIASAAGIGRRTFFRYFPSKNDVPWGDFEALLRSFQEDLTELDDVPMLEAIHSAVRQFTGAPTQKRMR